MKIQSIQFENFRNIADLTLTLDDGIWLIAGQNAQGKTNILEGIYLASTLRSFRTSKESQLIRYGQKRAKVTLWYEEAARTHTLEITLDDTAGKTVRFDGRRVQKNRDALGLFHSVLFTPDHLMMVKGAPSRRREFLDIALCGMRAKYTEYLLQYNKALKNRNRVLKQAEERPALMQTLPAWDNTLAGLGGFIAYQRQEYVERLAACAKTIYDEIAGGKEQLKVIYLNPFSKDRLTEREYAEKFSERLEKTRQSDLENGSTGTGMHKDDLLLLLGGKSAKFFASQGQIRSLALSLKLAEAKISEAESGKMPVILLDDIFSELDESRQRFIMQHTLANQCLVTTCEPDKLKQIDHHIIHIENGGIQCIST